MDNTKLDNMVEIYIKALTTCGCTITTILATATAKTLMQSYLDVVDIFTLIVQTGQKGLPTQNGLVIMDVFKGQITSVVNEYLTKKTPLRGKCSSKHDTFLPAIGCKGQWILQEYSKEKNYRLVCWPTIQATGEIET